MRARPALPTALPPDDQARGGPGPARLLLAVGLLVVAACARDPKLLRWEEDFYYTERLYVDGQHDLAARRFAALRKTAKDPRDADEAALLECEVRNRSGDLPLATACYDALATTAVDREMRMRAVLHGAELRYYDLGRQRDGLKMWQALCEKAADSVAALRALDHLTLHGQGDATRRDQMLALMRMLEKQDPLSELADNLLLRMAMLLEKDGSPAALEEATQLLERHESTHREDASFIDALMTRARLYGKLGKYKLEARDLERMLETYETSYIFASYAVDAHKDAAVRLIELYRGPLQDLERAEWVARRLPNMLRKPLKMPEYFMTVAAIQEERGQLRAALGTYRELLARIAARAADFRDNDERICREEETAEKRKVCFDDLRSRPPFEPKEADKARAAIARLEAQLKVRR